jgi:hypothetical protein
MGARLEGSGGAAWPEIAISSVFARTWREKWTAGRGTVRHDPDGNGTNGPACHDSVEK